LGGDSVRARNGRRASRTNTKPQGCWIRGNHMKCCVETWANHSGGADPGV